MTDRSVTMSLVNLDGDQDFPGEVHASVAYTVSADAERVGLVAATDRPTVVSPGETYRRSIDWRFAAAP